MNFKSLTTLVTSLTLLIIAEGAVSWGASELKETKSEFNTSGHMLISLKQNILTVSLKDADLQKVLKEISRKSSVKISFQSPIIEKVTLNFEKLHLEEGLKRLLRNQNSAFTYAEKKDTKSEQTQYVLSQVVVLEKSTSIQRGKKHRPAITDEVHISPTSRIPSKKEMSVEMIKELLIQNLPEQEETLKKLMEEINPKVEQVHSQIERVIEQLRKVEDGNPGVEAIERILRGGEVEKVEPIIHK